MASQLPGRTDNDVKNYWNTRLKKKLLAVAGKNTNINSSRGSKKSNNTNNIMEKSLISIPEADQSTYTINPENSSSLLPPLTDMGFEQNYYCDIPQELNLEQKNQLIPLSSTFMELPNFSPYGCDNNYITTSTVSSLSSPSSRETLMNNNLRSAAVGDGSSLLLDEDGIFLPDIELLDQSSYYYEQVNVFGNFS
ncbi:hypothetical protein JCGZ_07334 [Jatropha curcas]|uniref:HTH myb-type domain-containing protein n=2 Tax=Jatropha curcas TaxID=180498 RepID=A0A067KFL7_JATCU|nr:hypothetical protein JCGZ_07334 [Jatropha curcas]